MNSIKNWKRISFHLAMTQSWMSRAVGHHNLWHMCLFPSTCTHKSEKEFPTHTNHTTQPHIAIDIPVYISICRTLGGHLFYAYM